MFVLGLALTACTGGSELASNDVTVESNAAETPEPLPTTVSLEVPAIDGGSESAPLSLALQAPTLAPTPTPTPRPTAADEGASLTPEPDPTGTEEGRGAAAFDPASNEASDSASNEASDSASNEAGPATQSTSTAAQSQPEGGSLEPTPAPTESTTDLEGATDDLTTDVTSDGVVVHSDGVGAYRWGDDADAITAYVTERLGTRATVVDPANATTGRRQLTWPGFIIELNAEGGLAQWYWYPSFADGVVVPELGTYQGGLRFERQPGGTTVQTIGAEPNLWWVGSTLALRYAWDQVANPPDRSSAVVGAVIYVAASAQPAISSGTATSVPAGTEVLMSPNGPLLYTLEEATSVTVYRYETHGAETWALVVPAAAEGGAPAATEGGTSDALAGYVVTPAEASSHESP